MYPKLGPAELEFISRIAKLSASWGLGEAVGKVLAVLLLYDEPLTQEDIAKLTGYSTGRVSSSLGVLESMGLVYYHKEGRRKLYKAAGTLLDVMEHFLERMVRHQLAPTIRFVRENMPHFNERTRKRIEHLLQEYEKAKALLEMNVNHIRKWKKTLLRDLRGIRAGFP